MCSWRQHLPQRDFFELLDSAGGPKPADDGVPDKVQYNFMAERLVTFQDGLDTAPHSWFRLTPSFGPYLVREILSSLNCGSEDVVLDPFAGAGTTLIECQLEGLTCYGFEINPFLHFVCETSLNWTLSPDELRVALGSISHQFSDLNGAVTMESLELHGLHLPRIYNPTRWWKPDVLKELLVLKSCIDKVEGICIRAFFQLALAAVLVPDLTNVNLGRLQLVFEDRAHVDMRVLPTFLSQAERMIEELCALRDTARPRTSHAFLADSTDLGDLKLDALASCVVTSPPYPNRYSYVWNTRPHLYFFEWFDQAKQASELDKATIGGTWGTATSMLAKGKVMPECLAVDMAFSAVAQDIREVDNLMANYAMKYFNLLARQITEMDHLLTRDARIAYVVGCSRLKGVYIETDVILGKIIEGLDLGYRVGPIERIRKRHSGKDLYESVVYAWKE